MALFETDANVKEVTLLGYIVEPTWGANTGLVAASGTLRPTMQWLVSSGYLLKRAGGNRSVGGGAWRGRGRPPSQHLGDCPGDGVQVVLVHGGNADAAAVDDVQAELGAQAAHLF